MEPFSLVLLISGVTVAIYQMSGTPFILNVIIFCAGLLLSLYAMFVSGYLIPSDALFYWIYSTNKKSATLTDDNFSGHDDQITKRLRELTGHIVRDFILSWYNAVTDDVTFVQEAFELFEHVLKGARCRVSSTDKERLLINILSMLLNHFITYKNAQEEISSKSYNGLDEEGIKRNKQLIIIAYLEKNNHQAMTNLPDSEMEYLRGVVILLLKGLLPEDYKLTGTPLYLVRELIAQNVLSSLVNLLSDPLWIYNTIVKILEDSEVTEELNLEIPKRDNTVADENCVNNNTESESEEVTRAKEDSNFVSFVNDKTLLLKSETEVSMSTSLASTTSIMSHDSMDSNSIDRSEDTSRSPSSLEEVPLPLMSFASHFGSEASGVDETSGSMQKQLVSIAEERKQQDRLFLRMRIPEAVEMKENFDGGGKYTLYRITYRTKENDLQTAVAINIPNGEEASMSQGDTSHPLETVRTKRHQVQRRFREFRVLQERLSRNMVAKNLLADINGPSRMFPVPFGNMDKEYIEQRRKFLQAYLREICSISFISQCKELREFLAYEMDPRIAYVKKPNSIPRFDKLFKSAIQDLLGSYSMKFSTSMPENELFLENGFQEPSVKSQDLVNNELTNIGAVAKLKNKMFGLSKHTMRDDSSTNVKRQFGSFEGQRYVFSTSWKLEDEVQNPLTLPQINVSSRQNMISRGSGDGCDFSNVTGENNTPFNASSASLIFQLLLHIWKVRPGSQGLATVTFSKYIQAFLTEKVDDLTTNTSWTKYLETLHEALWPNGEWNSGDSENLTWDTAPDDVKVDAEKRVQEILEKELPKAIPLLVDQKTYKNGIQQVIKSLQNTNINRHMFYRLLDLIVNELFPDLNEVINRNNVSLDIILSHSS